MRDNIGMSSPVMPEQLAALPPEIRALLQAVIDHYEARIAKLQAELDRLKKTPRNSSLPPSSEHPHAKPALPKPKSKKKRGGQPGHPKHERALIPAEECQAVIPLRREAAGRRSGALAAPGVGIAGDQASGCGRFSNTRAWE